MLRSDRTEIAILHETKAFDTQLSFSYLVQSILKMIIIGELEPDKVNAAIILARKNVEQFQIDSVPIRVELQFRSISVGKITHGSQSSYDIYAVAVNGQSSKRILHHTQLRSTCCRPWIELERFQWLWLETGGQRERDIKNNDRRSYTWLDLDWIM